MICIFHPHQDTISKQIVYVVTFPNLNIQHSFNLPIKNVKVINALFQTNSGQIYLLYNHNIYIEFNEPGEILNRERTRDLFPGIPEHLTSAFRYIDGHIYFFYRNTYYKYSEYTKNCRNRNPQLESVWRTMSLHIESIKNYVNKNNFVL
ncbi:unnamed protein product [Psylliodes chrysocephalus]|uniref:Uncharacterized protein n=1 Tax=Psylliodes chrysocephalus TaxID=3402493 RepID=A0A9P0CY44_9CUCU|nr:unnamed protein product [Psylliodes chrysocephala]